MKNKRHRWLWAVAWLLGLGCSAVLFAQTAPGVSTIVHDLKRWPQMEKISLGRPSAAATPASPISFSAAFRGDPLVGMVKLEQWGLALQLNHGSAASALHHTLTLSGAFSAHAHDALSPETSETLTISWPTSLPQELRRPIAALLQAIAQAQNWRVKALAKWPNEITPADLRHKFSRWGDESNASDDSLPATTTLLGHIDPQSLAQGIWQLTAAVEEATTDLEKELRSGNTPQDAWQFDTPWGPVVIDTRPHNQHYRGQQPLLLIDTAGNDLYAFDQERPPGVTVLLDLAGNDHYQAQGPGHDPSSAVLGYAVLLDASGNDRYEGDKLTQAATLFGAAVLIDRQGDDRYETRGQAQGQAQGFALGGIAALFDFDGNDQYQALTQAQASAGPGAVALLFDQRGDDRYTLSSQPLVLPSAQLKSSNASLGQGTAFGLRSKSGEGTSTAPGGFALLLDAAGNDFYEAQVFAQGAGYEGGLGVLWDVNGSDRMQAAWYALGAAAHHAGGVFVAGGKGKDVYNVSHVTSLGAAHDESVAFFVGGLGDDRYSLSSLGLGTAHDASTALFIERGGNDHYTHTHPLCRGFAASVYSGPQPVTQEEKAKQQRSVNLALFLDLSGVDHYPPQCPKASNSLRWTSGDSTTGWGWGLDVANGIQRH